MKVTITVKRPTGQIETITKDMPIGCNAKRFAEIQKATNDAGRGEVLNYVNHCPKPIDWKAIKRGKMLMYGTMSTGTIRRERKLNEDENVIINDHK